MQIVRVSNSYSKNFNEWFSNALKIILLFIVTKRHVERVRVQNNWWKTHHCKETASPLAGPQWQKLHMPVVTPLAVRHRLAGDERNHRKSIRVADLDHGTIGPWKNSWDFSLLHAALRACKITPSDLHQRHALALQFYFNISFS